MGNHFITQFSYIFQIFELLRIDYLNTTYVVCVEGGDPNLMKPLVLISNHPTLWGYSQQNSYSGKLTFLQPKKKMGLGAFRLKLIYKPASNSNISILCGFE